MTSMAASTPQSTPVRKPPRLNIRGPVMLGLTVVGLFFGAGIGGAAYAPIDKSVGVSGTIIVETKVKTVQHQRGGTVDRIHVAEGQDVKVGQLLISLDSKSIDDQLAALKARAEAAQRQLSLIRQEAATFTDLMDRKLASKSKVLALERQVAEVEKENAGLSARIALAEQELQRNEIRAPASGRILSLAVTGPGAVIQPGSTVVEIVPEQDRLVIEGKVTPTSIDNVKPGMPAKVWLTSLSWRDQRPLRGKLAWVSPDSVEDKRTGASYFIARVELEEGPAEISRRLKLVPGMRTEMLLLTGERTLLDQLIDPLLRNINRAFRA